MKFVHLLASALVLSTTLYAGSALAAGDAGKGKKVFNKCKACHTVKAGKHKIGPSLAGVVGRKAGSAAGFKKYKGLKGADWTWNDAELAKFLTNPKKYLKGKTGKRSAMALKVKKKKDRENVIAYLNSIK
jgi:cytochrome c2